MGTIKGRGPTHKYVATIKANEPTYKIKLNMRKDS